MTKAKKKTKVKAKPRVKPKAKPKPKARPKTKAKPRPKVAKISIEDRLERIEAALATLAAQPSQVVKPIVRSQTPAAPPAASLPVHPAGADTAEFLSRTPLFAKLSPPECAILAQHCQMKEIPAGAMLFAEGDFGDSLYVVKEGALEIFKKDVLGDLPIAVIRPGGMVGEMALIEGKPRSANVRAVEQGKLLFLSKAAYERLKRDSPQVATKFQDELLLLFSNRLRQTTEKLVDTGEKSEPRAPKGI